MNPFFRETPYFDFILRLNRRLVAFISSDRLTLSIDESHILAEIACRKGSSSKQLCQDLQLEKSIVSRAVHRLESRGCLQITPCKEDKRIKFLSLTQVGQAVLQEDILQRNLVVERCVSPLGQQQQEELRSYLQTIADYLCPQPLDVPMGEHPIETQIRRLTRSLAVMSDNYLSTGLSVPACQLLFQLYSRPESKLTFAQLKSELPYANTPLTRLVLSLEMQGFISKHAAEDDHRSRTITWANQGLSKFKQIAIGADRILVNSLNSLSKTARAKFLDLGAVFLSEPLNAVVLEQTRLILLRSEKQIRLARKFVVEQLVLHRQHENLDVELLSSSSEILGVLNADKMLGIAELSIVGQSMKLKQFCYVDETTAQILLEGILRRLAKLGGKLELLYPASACSVLARAGLEKFISADSLRSIVARVFN